MNSFCFLKVAHKNVFIINGGIFNYLDKFGHLIGNTKMLKYALVEVFEEKENSGDFVMCDNCRGCCVVGIARNSFFEEK